MRILQKARTAISLDPNARWLIAAATLLPLVIAAGFRLIGVARTQKCLRVWASRGNRRRRSDDRDELIRGAQRAQRIIKRNTGIEGTCLVRSLTLWALLLRFGLHTDVRLGMRKRDGNMEGHAWLEHQGRPLNEDDDMIRTYSVYPHPISFDAWMANQK